MGVYKRGPFQIYRLPTQNSEYIAYVRATLEPIYSELCVGVAKKLTDRGDTSVMFISIFNQIWKMFQ